ncbi:MAG: Gfo/Idh/MocA family oxidoreductase, partial [Balneolaceae bacterium]|nr:Gfo/Idh/MocA family oxidoreductase [Balneolaceae bacterium]
MDGKDNGHSRRDFLRQLALGGAGLTLGVSAKSYGNIIGANEQVNIGVAGLNGRGKALMRAVQDVPNARLTHVCDVDRRAMEEAASIAKNDFGVQVKSQGDIRKLVENSDVDAIAIATPDHWHAPMTIMGVKAGKHVYVEKPCSHNPREGEMLIEAREKYGKVIQMGNQQRSAPTSIQAVQDIREGIIGTPYFGKAWYSNARGPIGQAKQAPVPDWLNWELWQGPAPRRRFEDIWVHYNWHWHWNWGTGEINNNGTHEIDICRWALGVDYPVKTTSSGGRYHYNDDWQFYDTQIANFEFEGDKMITWEGKSCNPFNYHDRGRGATIHGTEGTILLDRNGYMAWD